MRTKGKFLELRGRKHGSASQEPKPRGRNLRKQQALSQSLAFYFCFLLLPTVGGWGHPSAWVYIFWVATTNSDCLGFHRPASTLLQSNSVAQSCPTLCNLMNRSTPGLPVHPQLPELAQTHVHRVGDAIQASLSLSSPSLPVFLSIGVFSNGSILHIRWPKDQSFSFSINPSNEYSGLTSFTMDWLDLLAVQGTLKSLLQHHRSKASIL